MTLKDRLRVLCDQKNISFNKLEDLLGFGKGYISKLGSTEPNAKKIRQMADYFDVTADYLLTGNQPDNSERKVEEYLLSHVVEQLEKEILESKKEKN